MATKNFFDLLGDDENEDPSQVVLRSNHNNGESKSSAVAVKKSTSPSVVPTKPASPVEAVKDGQRGQYDGVRGGRGGGRGGRVGGGNYGDREMTFREGIGHKERKYNVDPSVGQTRDAEGSLATRGSFVEKSLRLENGESRLYEGSRGGARGRGRSGRGFGDGEERHRRREFDRHSGNARGNETEKRAGAGRGNWGSEVDANLFQGSAEAVLGEKTSGTDCYLDSKLELEGPPDVTVEEVAPVSSKDDDEEDNEMTLEQYEKVLEEKRKALESEKASERKVQVDKAFENMHLVDNKKREEDIFIKLGQDKEKFKRDAAEREEKSRKPVNINEFLKPSEGERYYGPPSNRGRGGRGVRGDRREGGGRGDNDFAGGRFSSSRTSGGGASAPKIEDQAQFPILGAK